MQKKTLQWVDAALNKLHLTMYEMLQWKLLHLMHFVCEMQEWDEQQYAEFQYNAGRTYLKYVTNNDEDVIAELEANKMFWNWWKQEWMVRDEDYYSNAVVQLSYSKRVEVYLQKHNVKHLAMEIYPEGKMLGKGYSTMIGSIIKKEVSE